MAPNRSNLHTGPFTESKPPLTPEEARKQQEVEILDYLTSEVRSDKHDWLRETDAQKILDQANSSPTKALEWWAYVSGDETFEVWVPDVLMTEDQKQVKKDILMYLEQDMQSRHTVNQNMKQKILSQAEKKPDKGLKEWQRLTKNYTFNPYASSLNARELAINNYLVNQFMDESRKLNDKLQKEVTHYLHRDPMKAYDSWEAYTRDDTFDVKTGIPKVETQAKHLITSLRGKIPLSEQESLREQLLTSPEAVLEKCQALIKQNTFDENVKQFIKLSEAYENLSWVEQKNSTIENDLKKITDKYLKDEEFKKAVDASKSDIASHRLAEELRQQSREFQKGGLDR